MSYQPFKVTQAHLDFLRENRISHSTNDDDAGWLKVGAIYKPARECLLEPYTCQRVGPYFNSMGAFSYSRSLFAGLATIGRYCAIGEWVRVMLASHPMSRVGMCGFDYAYASPYKMFADDRGVTFERTPVIESDPMIEIGHDVWIGNEARLARGIKIGTGAVVAAFAVVTKDVEPYTVVAGNPARPKKRRFSDEMCEQLLASEWWCYAFTDFVGMDTLHPERFLDQFGEAVSSGVIKPFVTEKINLHREFARVTAEQESRSNVPAPQYSKKRPGTSFLSGLKKFYGRS
ncbi:CatB-related O-acetyltransferase [Ciceribacter azotifigens]|uniref:CatB-related O-acetyltransferase n=1 Tax=Ciceribacter azotifigens TaxID=2069303 RepID=UPI003A8B8E6C